MTLRAVLIGAQTYGLTGVHADVRLMHEVLRKHGFTDIVTRTKELARYAGIKEALSRLRAATRPGDGVVVYYSGHGALLGELQYLVPVDMADSTPTDFRGYLAEELTAAVRTLTDVTPNVTVILDCCHSGGAVREAAQESGRWALKSVELPRVARGAGLERAAALSRPGDPLVPDVVRLTACQQHDSAYEAELRPGAGRQGVFTAALAKVLDPRRHPRVPWSVLVAHARDRIKQQQVRQWPDAGGPSGRLPFSLEEPSEPERLPLVRRDGRFVVPGGAVFGLGLEDSVSMMFPGGHEKDAGHEFSVPATVDAMKAGDALLRTTPSAASPSLAGDLRTAALPPGAYALVVRVHDRRNVLIDARAPFAEALRKELARCPRLAETDDERDAFATVRATQPGRCEVLNAEGHPFRKPAGTAHSDPARLTALLEELARGERVRSLRDPEGAGRLDAGLEVRFEAEHPAGSGDWRMLRPVGERLYGGDSYRVTVANLSGVPLYFWVIGVGLSGRTALVTNDQPSGYRLEPYGDEHRSTRTTASVRIYWPSDVPAQGPRPETVHLLVGDRPMDLRGLASREAPSRSACTTDPALGALLQELWYGVRDQLLDVGEEFHYRVWTVHADALPQSRESEA
ncbi:MULTISPECIES: caspase family protein [unclassified Streptomyces]|uniref:caspase family protein n=1 Tax=unclassified Streptomyces TaxID=2593676 RepID=UPI002DDB4C57|nr:caspase family protein [Streptomyces sp. NBC_01750]WSA98724.1 caspase family protein [Streptomyces sp. NBC_01794]WSD36706.1 caspase family protein [Streptomyces sp. NBC_01750]